MADPKLYRRDEVAKNNSSQSGWIIIHNSVYNVTEFLNEVSLTTCYIFIRSDLQNIFVLWPIVWLLASVSPVWLNYKREYDSKVITFCSIQEVKKFYWNKLEKMVQKLLKMLVIPQMHGNWWRNIKLEILLRYISIKLTLSKINFPVNSSEQ